MKPSKHILLISRLLLRVWLRKAKSIIAGKPHMYALLLVAGVLYAFFAWQMRQILAPLDGMVGGTGQHYMLLSLVTGLLFGIVISSTWFIAKQSISDEPPAALLALPLANSTWLYGQTVLFIGAVWLMNTVLMAPLFIALGQLYHLTPVPWLLLAETSLLLAVLFGVVLYIGIEGRLQTLARSHGSLAKRLAGVHIIGLAVLLAYSGYSVLFAKGVLHTLNAGFPAVLYIEHGLLASGIDGELRVLLLVVLAVLALMGLVHLLLRYVPTAVTLRPAAEPLSAKLLPLPSAGWASLVRVALRALLSDKDATLPNIIFILLLLGGAIAVRLGVMSASTGATLHSIYDSIFILLFAAWGLSLRGKLGTQRSTLYGFPLSSRNVILTTAVTTMVFVMAVYAAMDLVLYAILNDLTAAMFPTLLQNLCMLTALTALAYALGVVSYAGQKSKLSQLPVAIACVFTSIMVLVLLSWVLSKYGLWALSCAAALLVVAAIGLAADYEKKHVLDAV